MTDLESTMTRHEAGRRAVLSLAVVSMCVVLLGCQSTEYRDWDEVDQLIHDTFPDVPSVTTAQLAEALAAERPVLLLDAREPEEFEVSHLLGAQRVSSAADAVALLEDVGPETLVVAYCSVGYRSAALVAELREQGVTGAMNLRGSIFAWANEGRPLYRERMVVDKVHPFSDSWGALLDPIYWAFEP